MRQWFLLHPLLILSFCFLLKFVYVELLLNFGCKGITNNSFDKNNIFYQIIYFVYRILIVDCRELCVYDITFIIFICFISFVRKNVMSEFWGQISELWGQSSELRGQSSEFWGQSSEFWGQSSEFWGQSSEFRGQTSESWGQSSELRGRRVHLWGQTSEFISQRIYLWGQRVHLRGKLIESWGEKNRCKLVSSLHLPCYEKSNLKNNCYLTCTFLALFPFVEESSTI